MQVDEVDLVVDYFHGSTDEHLVTLGVDRAKLPAPAAFRQLLEREFNRPVPERDRLLVIWESDDAPVGFSSCDTITVGNEAKMHLHVVAPEHRRQGIGTECVRQTVRSTSTASRSSACSPSRTCTTRRRTARCNGSGSGSS